MLFPAVPGSNVRGRKRGGHNYVVDAVLLEGRSAREVARVHKGRPMKLLIADQSIRVIDLEGELIRELTLDPSRNYQPLTHG